MYLHDVSGPDDPGGDEGQQLYCVNVPNRKAEIGSQNFQ